MVKKSGIYCIFNRVNKKMYIGSAVNLKRRKTVHFCTLKSNSHFNGYLQNAYNKYSKENFLFVILEYVEPSNLINREQYWIDYIGIENLYNSRPIANSPLGTTRGKTSIEKQKYTYAKNGGSKLRKPVHQINIKSGDIIKTWNSVYEAAQTLKISPSNIRDVCRNKIKSVGGFFWSFTENYTVPSILERGETSRKAINQIDCSTGEIINTFRSIADASIFTKIQRRNINFVCQGKRRKAGGYRWEYIK